MGRNLKYNILNNGIDGWVFCGFCKNYQRKGFCLSTYPTTQDTQIHCAGFQMSKDAEELRQKAREKRDADAKIQQGKLFADWEMI